MDNKNITDQRLELYNRGNLKINDCLDVHNFNDETVVLETSLGILTINGEELKIEKLNLEEAMNQAIRDSLASNRTAFPTVFHKKNYKGLLVTMRFDDWIQLYNEYYSSMKLKEKL